MDQGCWRATIEWVKNTRFIQRNHLFWDVILLMKVKSFGDPSGSYSIRQEPLSLKCVSLMRCRLPNGGLLLRNRLEESKAGVLAKKHRGQRFKRERAHLAAGFSISLL